MKNVRANSSLFLIELVIVILFFSISAAIGMRVFASAKIMSVNSNALSRGSVAAESMAECYKAADGDLEVLADITGGVPGADTLTLYYDQEWQRCGADSAHFVLMLKETAPQTATIAVVQLGSQVEETQRDLFTLDVKAVV